MTTASKIFLHRKRVCDFCGKGEDAVGVLIVSPGEKADICDECVGVCVEALVDHAAKKKATPNQTGEVDRT